eukprot:scaffold47921_cov55-Attheya_sp.AAC.3
MDEHTKSMAVLISTITAIDKAAHEEKLEKYKHDLSNQVKADMIICIDSIDAKVADVESDMQRDNLNIDDLKALQTEVTPKIDQAITRPASSDTSLNARNDSFPRFSGYMGTGTTLQKPVPSDEYYESVLPAGPSDTNSYVDHNILLTNQVQSDLKTSTDEIDNRIDSSNSTMQLSTDNCIDEVYTTQVTSDFTGNIPVSPSKLEPVEQIVALPPPPSPPTENMDFPLFSCYMGTPTNLQPTVLPADDFSKFLLHARTSDTDSYIDHNIFCTSTDDDSTGLPPEQSLFPFANHSTISDVGRFMKNLKDLPACVCTSADDLTGLLPEQGLFSFVNHTQFLTSADLSRI